MTISNVALIFPRATPTDSDSVSDSVSDSEPTTGFAGKTKLSARQLTPVEIEQSRTSNIGAGSAATADIDAATADIDPRMTQLFRVRHVRMHISNAAPIFPTTTPTAKLFLRRPLFQPETLQTF